MPLIQLEHLGTLQLAPGITAKIVTAETMTVAHVELKAGSPLPEHSHVHEQVVNVIDGELELTVAGTPHRLTRGRVFVLPSNIPHTGRAITDCYVIDVFHPVREDFRGASFAGYDTSDD
jgi:quercetin dioxygenase-like cupin family protein